MQLTDKELRAADKADVGEMSDDLFDPKKNRGEDGELFEGDMKGDPFKRLKVSKTRS